MTIKVQLDSKIQNELNKNVKVYSIISLSIGAVGLIVFAIISMFFKPAPSWINYFLLFLIPFILGTIFMINVLQTNDSVLKNKMEEIYDFKKEFMTIETFKNGTHIASSKVFYKQIVKVRETKHYLFIYPDKITAFPVPKDSLKLEDYATLKIWIAEARMLTEN